MSGPGSAWAPRVLAALAQRPRIALALLCLVLWLPGIVSLPPLDRDESRFAQSSKQMLESGNLIDIRFGHVPRYKKPAGIYWLQSATTAIAGFGDHGRIWTYRLASLLGGIVAVWLTFWMARAVVPAEAALLAAALQATALLTTAEATIATTDAVLLACFLGAQGVLMRVYLAAHDPSRPAPSLAAIYSGWAAFGLSVLVKGPVAPAVCALTALAITAWDRDWRWLRQVKPVSGLALAAAIVLPWAIAIEVESHGQFYGQSLGTDFAAKLEGAKETHGAPPGYYLALVTLTFWPAVLFLFPSIGSAARRRTEPALRFLLVWAVAAWLTFELVPTKLPHYILPVYPALAILAALWIALPRTAERGWLRAPALIGLVQFALGAVAIAAAAIALPLAYGQGILMAPVALAVLALGLSIATATAFLQGDKQEAALLAMCAALVLYPTLTLGVAPSLQRIWVSPRAAALVAKDAHPDDPPATLAGYEEPSLVFLLGGETRLTDGDGAATITAEQGGLALVDDHERVAFLARLGAIGAQAAKVDELSGLNYSRGKPVHITVYRTNPMHFDTAPPAE